MQYDTVIAYLLWKEKNVTAGIGFMSGRICSLTTLVNLNTRLRTRPDGSNSGLPKVDQWHVEPAPSHAYDLDVVRVMSHGEGIAVRQSAIVHVENDSKAEFSGNTDPFASL
jgi:hypothetical protein